MLGPNIPLLACATWAEYAGRFLTRVSIAGRYYHNGEVYIGGWSKGNKHGVGVVNLPDSPHRHPIVPG